MPPQFRQWCCRWRRDVHMTTDDIGLTLIHLASYPGSLGEGGKRAWYLLFEHALNYFTFQSFLISPGTSMLCWRHQPISRTLNFTLEKWIARFCTLLNASAVLLWLWKRTNSLRQGHLWRKGRISLAAYRCWQVNVLWTTALRVWWQAGKTRQNH